MGDRPLSPLIGQAVGTADRDAGGGPPINTGSRSEISGTQHRRQRQHEHGLPATYRSSECEAIRRARRAPRRKGESAALRRSCGGSRAEDGPRT